MYDKTLSTNDNSSQAISPRAIGCLGELFFIPVSYTRMNKYLVEFVGSILFVYVILATGNPLAIGAALALIILIASPISGGHINPAVSVVMSSAGRLPTMDLLPYVVAQVLGGLVALQLYKRYK
jgi:hypothetical protein